MVVEAVVVETPGVLLDPPPPPPPPPPLEEIKFAVTEVSAVTVKIQELVPEHPAPDQPVKADPEEAEAVRVIDVPEDIPDCAQVDPQEIEPPAIVPLPVPDL